ncbi:MAG TPA: peptidoglycan-associated lipoprotein Pal [Candidatus Nitrosotalea sp.]|nr:peptidoglycan-associated lipoprotein Pal [Candidatus Nitrosotalea sp.]
MRVHRPSLWIWPTTTLRGTPGRTKAALQFLLVSAALALLTACPPKNPPVVQTTPPPAPPAPTASIEANPATVQQGQSITVTWKTENATDVAIAQIGAVQPNGSQTVTPADSTPYHITAKGPGGVQEADARVTVVPAAATQTATQANDGSSADAANRLDVFFDLDDFSIRPDQVVTIQTDAQFLKEHPEMNIVVEGHCDELGSTEYNLALGDKRAAQVRAALEKAGIPTNRMRTISYGKEMPVCTDQNEGCWRMNRRAHITPDIQR